MSESLIIPQEKEVLCVRPYESSVLLFCSTFVRVCVLSLDDQRLSIDLVIPLRFQSVVESQVCTLSGLHEAQEIILCKGSLCKIKNIHLPSFCAAIPTCSQSGISRTLGLFSVTFREQEEPSHSLLHQPQSSSAEGSIMTPHEYTLVESMTLDENHRILSLAPVPPKTFEDRFLTEAVVVMSTRLDPMEGGDVVVIQLVSTPHMKSLTAPQELSLPCVLRESLLGMNMTVIQSYDSPYWLILLWSCHTKVEQNLPIGVVGYDISNNRLCSLGWYPIEAPVPQCSLVSLESTQWEVSPAHFHLVPNVAVVWNKESCHFYAMQWLGKKELHIRPCRTFSYHQLSSFPENSRLVCCVPLESFLALYGLYEEGQLKLSVSNVLHGTSWALGPHDECKSSFFSLQGSAVPTHFSYLILSESSSAFLVVLPQEIRLFRISHHALGQGSKILQPQRPSGDTVWELPPDHVLKELNFADLPLLRKVYHLVMKSNGELPAEMLEKKIEIENSINSLLRAGLLPLTWPVMERLINLQLKGCCRYALQSSLVTEALLVTLLQRHPKEFLSDIVRYLNITRDIFVDALRVHLEKPQVEYIFKYLTAWCTILTGLPQALVEPETFPPLDQVLNFISLLIDAKFQELITVSNPLIMDSLKTLALNLSDCLLAKKTVQKFLGQLHALRNAQHHVKTIAQIQHAQDLWHVATFDHMALFCTLLSCITMSAVYDRFNIHAQLEHLQSKYQGTGNADMTKWQWGVNIHRDTYASNVGHYSRLAYIATAENSSIARLKFEFLQAMIRPCGPAPPKNDDFDIPE